MKWRWAIACGVWILAVLAWASALAPQKPPPSLTVSHFFSGNYLVLNAETQGLAEIVVHGWRRLPDSPPGLGHVTENEPYPFAFIGRSPVEVTIAVKPGERWWLEVASKLCDPFVTGWLEQ